MTKMIDKTLMKECIESAAHWDALADEALRMAEHNEVYTGSGSADWNKAKVYKDTAQALRLQAETGESHCSCCLKPRKICECVAEKLRITTR